MIGMPAIADIALLLRLLAHFRDHRKARHGSEEAIDVDVAEAAGESDVLLRRQLLVAEEHNPILAQSSPDHGQLGLVGGCREIDPGDLGADRARERSY